MGTKDHDGKSQTASAADVERYPRPDDINTSPSREQIETLAYRLWMEHGQLDGGAERDWLEAEQTLQGDRNRAQVADLHEQAGSVQR